MMFDWMEDMFSSVGDFVGDLFGDSPSPSSSGTGLTVGSPADPYSLSLYNDTGTGGQGLQFDSPDDLYSTDLIDYTGGDGLGFTYDPIAYDWGGGGGGSTDVTETANTVFNTLAKGAMSIFGSSMGQTLIGAALKGYGESEQMKAAIKQRDLEQRRTFDQTLQLRGIDHTNSLSLLDDRQEFEMSTIGLNHANNQSLQDDRQEFEMGTIGVNHANSKEMAELQKEYAKEMAAVQNEYAKEMAAYEQALEKEAQAIRLGDVSTIR
jgi:hypothetical protein